MFGLPGIDRATYEARRVSDRTDAWEVIGTYDNGYRFAVATFVGPEGETRAKDYVEWQMSKRGGRS